MIFTLTKQQQDIEKYLQSSHKPQLIDEVEVANSLEENPAFYTRWDMDLYRYIETYYDAERDTKPEVTRGTTFDIIYTAYIFTGSAPSLANMYATNDAKKIDELKNAGLTTEYEWSSEPYRVTLGGDKLMSGLNTALDGCREGDKVEIVVARRSRSGELEGTIVAVTERSTRPYVGTAQLTTNSIFVTPDSRRIGTDIYLPRKQNHKVEEGDKVLVRVVDWPDGERLPHGELVDILGKAGDNDTEMHAILAEFDLPYKFEESVLHDAECISGKITDKEIARRRDMRDRKTFTIDPADAKDFDDALSIRKIEEGLWEIGVHIADVTHYVTPGSIVDNEAQERATSVYLVDRTKSFSINVGYIL